MGRTSETRALLPSASSPLRKLPSSPGHRCDGERGTVVALVGSRRNTGARAIAVNSAAPSLSGGDLRRPRSFRNRTTGDQ